MCTYDDGGALGDSGGGTYVWAVRGGSAVQESQSRIELGNARLGSPTSCCS
jgi:hypothetical protein